MPRGTSAFARRSLASASKRRAFFYQHPDPRNTNRNGPRKLDSALSEIFLRFQATNLTLA